jgi:maleamate amidohydrolase
MTTDEIYRKQQFGQKIGLGKRPALLVVDFVNGFADPQLLGGGNIGDAIGATVPLLGFFRERQLLVIFTRIVYAEDGTDSGIWCGRRPASGS